MSAVALNADGLRMILRYETARKAMAMWEAEKAASRDELIEFLAEADHASYMGRELVTVSRTRPRRFDQSAFAADHPALFERYRRESDTDEIRLILARNIPNLPHWYADGTT
jgi:hypothetical protein